MRVLFICLLLVGCSKHSKDRGIEGGCTVTCEECKKMSVDCQRNSDKDIGATLK